jgi:hypothetical protein
VNDAGADTVTEYQTVVCSSLCTSPTKTLTICPQEFKPIVQVKSSPEVNASSDPGEDEHIQTYSEQEDWYEYARRDPRQLKPSELRAEVPDRATSFNRCPVSDFRTTNLAMPEPISTNACSV